jgi:hypothetical protein
VRPRRTVQASLLLVAAGVLATGCGSVLPPEVFTRTCPAALLEGTLVRNEEFGIGVHQAGVDVTYPVDWPDGWAMGQVEGVWVVFSADGSVAGREGDSFSAGGGFTSGPNEVFQPCGGIRITASDP